MATQANPTTKIDTTIDPMRLSVGELEFLLEGKNLEQSPTVVFAAPIPDKYNVTTEVVQDDGLIRRHTICTVNPSAVSEVLDKVQAVVQTQAAGRLLGRFVGYDAVREKLSVALEYNRRRQEAKRYNPTEGHPSMSSYDSTGRAHTQGVGSDSQRVVTYFDHQGKRHRYAFDLVEAPVGRRGGTAWAVMDVKEAVKPVVDKPSEYESPVDPEMPEVMSFVVNDTEHYVQCPVCKHVEQWKPQSAISRGHARNRMLKHCSSAKDEVQAHRRLAMESFE